ncbi:MAG: FlgN protein [Candidatus Atribacteria bacterium]|nr:FlgN protein [Candidatus Atribacteria bacterium]
MQELADFTKLLVEFLEKELEIEEQLLSLAQAKKDFLLENKMEALVPLLEEEIELATKSHHLQSQIGNLWQRMKMRFQLPETEMRISYIISLSSPEVGSRLRELQLQLSRVTKELKQINLQNEMLIRDTLNYIDAVFSLLVKTEDGSSFARGKSGILIDGKI